MEIKNVKSAKEICKLANALNIENQKIVLTLINEILKYQKN